MSTIFDMIGSSGIVSLIIGILVFVGIFFLVRLITLWYFKINRAVNLLERQNQLLLNILDKMDHISRNSEN